MMYAEPPPYTRTAIEGAVDAILGRPREHNPYSTTHAREYASAWELGWTEARELLEMRGAEEIARWLGEAA